MYEAELEPTEDDAVQTTKSDQNIDFDEDQIEVRDEADCDSRVEDEDPGDEARRIENADLDNAVDELVELVNGRDLDGLGDLLAPVVEAEFLGGSTREEVVEGFGDLFLRYPTLLTTRADLGPDPIVAVWTFDPESDRFDRFGFLLFEMSDGTEGLIERISYADELPDNDDLVVETPDRTDLPEWEEWVELDEN